MDKWDKKKVLMIVKTYPTPSKKYHETVCTAGVTSDGQWIRLYPIQFRYLKPEQKFEKYTWIEIDTKKNFQDIRPESYKANAETLKVLNKLDSKKDLEERKRMILPLCSPSLDFIQKRYTQTYHSLGLFKPKEVHDLIITPTEKEWTKQQQSILNQTSLFDNENVKTLEKVPWDFSFTFNCDDEACTKSHKLKVTDWELYQAFRKFRKYYGSEQIALQKLREKYMSFFTDPRRNSYLIVGTVHPYPTFIVIGVFTYIDNPIKQKETYQQLTIF